ncbi:DUF3239 domain-containing protein [Corynebacterium aquilae]|uniref:DUF3239 domain-containing protein n=1 Tax=Corynebacterium aquilae DSM 44791 TaxID=1431546 RepID=A0A1L7CEL1_9CORY|nr:DUF3239 domain-containing protein [Corynebacterium aquilae]APT84286.1 hypothetical protein CAQU_03495 [Corynebacterium aquilae DSM 44791]
MSAMHIEVDESYNAAHNELYRDARRLQWSSLVLGLLLLVGAGLSFWQKSSTTGLISGGLFAACGVGCLVLIPVLPRTIGSPADNYNRYPLVPAIVAKTSARDGVVLALVNTTIDPEGQPRWALAARTVTRINGVQPKKGARVPSVAVGGSSRKNELHYRQVSPMPVDWATPDKSVVKAAQKAIPHSEWTRLESLRDRVDDVLATKNNLLEL